MTITCDHVTEFGYGVFCSSSGTLWQLGPDLHSFHGWSCAGVPSWRKAELKAPVWLPQAGETLKKGLFKQWLRRLGLQGTSSYLCLKKDRTKKSIVECEKE